MHPPPQRLAARLQRWRLDGTGGGGKDGVLLVVVVGYSA